MNGKRPSPRRILTPACRRVCVKKWRISSPYGWRGCGVPRGQCRSRPSYLSELWPLASGNKSYFSTPETLATNPPSPGLPVQPGTAVGDLQALERNDALYADFDVLDELQVQDDVTANP